MQLLNAQLVADHLFRDNNLLHYFRPAGVSSKGFVRGRGTPALHTRSQLAKNNSYIVFMSTRTSHNNEAPLFYITFTCYQWLLLFELCNGYDLVYKWFEYLNEKYNIKTTAYTIMPNHVHCILFFLNEDYDLNKIVGNGKRFMAYELIKRLQAKRG